MLDLLIYTVTGLIIAGNKKSVTNNQIELKSQSQNNQSQNKTENQILNKTESESESALGYSNFDSILSAYKKDLSQDIKNILAPQVQQIIQPVKEQVQQVIQPVKEQVQQIINPIKEQVQEQFEEAVQPIIDYANTALNDFKNDVISPLKDWAKKQGVYLLGSEIIGFTTNPMLGVVIAFEALAIKFGTPYFKFMFANWGKPYYTLTDALKNLVFSCVDNIRYMRPNEFLNSIHDINYNRMSKVLEVIRNINLQFQGNNQYDAEKFYWFLICFERFYYTNIDKYPELVRKDYSTVYPARILLEYIDRFFILGVTIDHIIDWGYINYQIKNQNNTHMMQDWGEILKVPEKFNVNDMVKTESDSLNIYLSIDKINPVINIPINSSSSLKPDLIMTGN